MTTQHTPGPWKVVPNRTAGDNLYSIGTSDDQHTLADVWFCPAEGEGWHEVDHANARLIAAAPELLAALQSLIQYLPEEEIHYEDASAYRQIQRAVERAEAAIAKATNS